MTENESQWVTRETLLRRARDPADHAAWEEFVGYYRRYLYGLVRRMNLDHHDAEEIVQTVTVKLWQKLPEFRYDARKGRFRGWLCTVTGNEVKKFLGRKKRELDGAREHEADALRSYLAGVQLPDVSELAEREWRRYIANLAWERIQDHFESNAKRAFEMLSKGVSVPNVARELEIAQSSVYVYKKRVGDSLRDTIMRLNAELD